MAMVTGGLLNRFRAAGLAVNEMAGWQSRGESDGPFSIRGVLLHHDGMGLGNNNVAEYMSQDGVDGAQLWIKKDGTVFVMAAGRKWHAGLGSGWGSIPANHGNDCLLGIETDHTFGQPWTDPQHHAMIVVTQCAVAEYGLDVDQWVCGHKEYAPARKPDPENFDCNQWRADVKGSTPAPPPVEEDDMPYSPEQLAQFASSGAERALRSPVVTGADGNKFSLLDFIQSIDRRVTEVQARLRGADTASGQKHENYDMLQGIDSATADAQTRLRGGDTASGQKHENYDMLQGIDAQTSPKAS